MKFQELTKMIFNFVLALGLISCAEDPGAPSKKAPDLNPKILFNNGNLLQIKDADKENSFLSSNDTLEVNSKENFDLHVHSVCSVENNEIKEQTYKFKNQTRLQILSLLPHKVIYQNYVQNKEISCDFEFIYSSPTLKHRFYIRTSPIEIVPQDHQNYLLDKRTSSFTPNRINNQDFKLVDVISQNQEMSQWYLLCSKFNFSIKGRATKINVDDALTSALFQNQLPFYINSDTCIFLEHTPENKIAFTKPIQLEFPKALPIFIGTLYKKHSNHLKLSLDIYNPFTFPLKINSAFKQSASLQIINTNNIQAIKITHVNAPKKPFLVMPNQPVNISVEFLFPLNYPGGTLCVDKIVNEFVSEHSEQPILKVNSKLTNLCFPIHKAKKF